MADYGHWKDGKMREMLTQVEDAQRAAAAEMKNWQERIAEQTAAEVVKAVDRFRSKDQEAFVIEAAKWIIRDALEAVRYAQERMGG